MGEIEDAIQRADQDAFTRQPPKNLKARINFLVGKLKTTKAVATELGVSQRSVERYRTGSAGTRPNQSPTASTLPYAPAGSRRSEGATGNRPQPQPASPSRPGPASDTPRRSAPPTTAGCAG